MDKKERRRILDSIPPDERLRLLQRSRKIRTLSSRTIALCLLTLAVLVAVTLATLRAEIWRTQWTIAAVATTLLVAVGAFWPTRRNVSTLDDVLREVTHGASRN